MASAVGHVRCKKLGRHGEGEERGDCWRAWGAGIGHCGVGERDDEGLCFYFVPKELGETGRVLAYLVESTRVIPRPSMLLHA